MLILTVFSVVGISISEDHDTCYKDVGCLLKDRIRSDQKVIMMHSTIVTFQDEMFDDVGRNRICASFSQLWTLITEDRSVYWVAVTHINRVGQKTSEVTPSQTIVSISFCLVLENTGSQSSVISGLGHFSITYFSVAIGSSLKPVRRLLIPLMSNCTNFSCEREEADDASESECLWSLYFQFSSPLDEVTIVSQDGKVVVTISRRTSTVDTSTLDLQDKSSDPISASQNDTSADSVSATTAASMSVSASN
jgi:hypothetical protein